MHAQPSSLRRTFVRVLRPQGSRAARLARVVPRRQQPNDPYGDEERAFRAAFECRLAVVRAILVELSPGRCDGAPRGLEASSRDRDCATTCGTFAPGPGTSPEDARTPVGLVLSFWGLGCCGIVELGVTQNARNRVLLASAKRQRSVRSRAPQIRLRNDEQRCCRDQKLLHPILHGPAQVDKDATDGVSAGHLRRFGAAARKKCATAIARREAGTARRPSTRARWRGGGDTRENTPSPRR